MKNNRRTSAWPPNLIPVWVYTEVINIIISELKSIMNHIMTWNYHTFWANDKCQTFKMNVFYLLWLCFYSLWFFNIYIKYDVLDEFVYWSYLRHWLNALPRENYSNPICRTLSNVYISLQIAILQLFFFCFCFFLFHIIIKYFPLKK